ncbi:MAG: DUF4288 domain-containing protein [Pseudonocardiales bacterium]
MSAVWFSAMLRFMILVQGAGGDQMSRSVILFRAEDFPAAKARAVEIGLSMERTYTSNTDEEVRWRLVNIETLDMLDDEISDGREVYSEPVSLAPGTTIPFDMEFQPASRAPGQSGV